MRVIVSDTSCLIDLRKVRLLEAFLRTPFERVIPYTIFEDELLRFTDEERQLIAEHMEIVDSPSEQVVRAGRVNTENPALTLNDCFAYVIAESLDDCVLLTGDRSLRVLAERNKIEVHGVLWSLDMIREAALVPVSELIAALEYFRDDQTVHVPREHITRMLSRYRRLGR